jgi:hypothetical protein
MDFRDAAAFSLGLVCVIFTVLFVLSAFVIYTIAWFIYAVLFGIVSFFSLIGTLIGEMLP